MNLKKLAGHFRPYILVLFTLGITACGGGGGGSEDSTAAGTLQLSTTLHSATEGTDATVSITVTRNGGSDGAVSVDYDTSDNSANSATQVPDYTSTSGTLNWADGDSAAKTFTIAITNDDTAEPTEDFTVTLSNVSGATLGNNTSATVTIIDDDADLIQGQFIDVITGLQYVSGNQSGLTDINGGFICEAGSDIGFSIGDILLGTADCKALISPVDLVPGASDETHPTVSNIFAFLQTIDDDANPANGITITQAVIDAASDFSVDFNQSTADFSADTNVMYVVAELTAVTTAGVRSLVAALDAESDLKSILLSALAGIYNGTYSCESPCAAKGTWSMTIDTDGIITGSVCNLDTQVDFQITGNITSSGTSTIDASGAGADGSFSGAANLDGEFIGSWAVDTEGGPFIGNRQGISVGGNCVLPDGNLNISGIDTETMGLDFIPVYDGFSVVSDIQINIVALDLNPFLTPNVDTRTLEIFFNTDGEPLAIRFRKYLSGISENSIWGEYVAPCAQTDCTGASINTETQTISLSNVVVYPSTLVGNNATNTLSLDGSFTYTINTP